MMAARENKTEVVKVLLEYGADLAQKNDKGETAYDWAVREEHKPVIDLLKKASAR
jgi:ankyrin repeat protein